MQYVLDENFIFDFTVSDDFTVFDFTVSDDIMELVLRACHRMQAIWWISSKEYFVLADPLVCLSIPQENLLSPLAEESSAKNYQVH